MARKKVHIVASMDDVKKSQAWTWIGYLISAWIILKAFTGDMQLESRFYLGLFGLGLGIVFYFGDKWHKKQYGF